MFYFCLFNFCVHMYMCAHACGGQKLTLSVLPKHLSTFQILRLGLSVAQGSLNPGSICLLSTGIRTVEHTMHSFYVEPNTLMTKFSPQLLHLFCLFVMCVYPVEYMTTWGFYSVPFTFRSLCLESPGLPGLSQYSGIHKLSKHRSDQSLPALVIVHAHNRPFLGVTNFNKLQTHKDSSPREGQLCFRLVSLLKWSGSQRTVTFSGSFPAQEACSGSSKHAWPTSDWRKFQ